MARKTTKNTSSTRGKRYTTKQKADILSFVDKHNALNGRGGAAEASRKFDVSQLTIGNWQKEAGSPSPKRKKNTGDINKAIKRLGELHKEMAAKETELDKLRKEYAKLKSSI